jgi:hypothetical protein
VGKTGEHAGICRFVPDIESPGSCQGPNILFGKTAFRKRARDSCFGEGPDPRAISLKIIGIGTIEDGGGTGPLADEGKDSFLAEITPVFGVAPQFFREGHLHCLDLDPERRGYPNRFFEIAFREIGGVNGDRAKLPAAGLVAESPAVGSLTVADFFSEDFVVESSDRRGKKKRASGFFR